MDVAIIGTGNTATVLGKLISRAGHRIVQVYGRTQAHAAALAATLGASAVYDPAQLTGQAGIYIIAVSDAALPQVAAALALPDQLLVHTAGAVSKEVLKQAAVSYGVLYPLQSLRKEMTQLPLVPLLIDGSSPEVSAQLLAFAKTLSPVTGIAGDEDRLKLHAAAVLSSNFTNHLYVLAEDFCRASGLAFELLYPLIMETASRLKQYSPSITQTGPAIRGDEATIEKHLQLLEAFPEIKKLYAVLSESISTYCRSGA